MSHEKQNGNVKSSVLFYDCRMCISDIYYQ